MLVAGPRRSTPMVHGPTPPTYSLLPIPVLLSDNGRLQIAKQQMLPDEGDHTTGKDPWPLVNAVLSRARAVVREKSRYVTSEPILAGLPSPHTEAVTAPDLM